MNKLQNQKLKTITQFKANLLFSYSTRVRRADGADSASQAESRTAIYHALQTISSSLIDSQ